jgi:hypothetical protein
MILLRETLSIFDTELLSTLVLPTPNYVNNVDYSMFTKPRQVLVATMSTMTRPLETTFRYLS